MMDFGSFGAAVRAMRDYGLVELHFNAPWAFVGLVLLLPVIRGIFSFHGRLPVLIFSRGEAVSALGKGAGHRFFIGAKLLMFGAILCSLAALTQPRVLGEPDSQYAQGIDIVVVLDVSGSMRAADFKPKDRLTVAKQVIREHLLTRKRDKVGLVVFAGEAYTQVPLTLDKGLVEEMLEGVRTGVITDGTAIGDAVATGVNRLRDSQAMSKVMILITDGDNNAGNLSPEKAAELAKEFNVNVFPILVGKGGLVPYPSGQDFLGKTRYTKAEWPTNPELLKAIAKTSEGRFYRASRPKELAGSLQKILEEMDRSRLDLESDIRRPIDLAPLLLLPALLMLLLSLVIFMTKGSTLP